MMVLYLAITFFTSFLVCVILTPVVRRIALQKGFVDRPDGNRKLHGRAVALGGGLAVQIAVFITVVVLGITAFDSEASPPLDLRFYVGLLIASLFLMAVGIVDDAKGMRGRYKLAFQVVACLVLVASGLQIRSLSVAQLTIDLGWLAIPLTVAWLLGTINAINLLDGADGLASSVGSLLCLTIGVLAMLGGHMEDGLLAVAISAALAGFLLYNFAPASIYLGDTGSMFIGFLIGAIAIHDSIKGSTSLALATPLCLVIIPAFDSCAALIRRKLTGRSLFAPDRGHFHHVLLQRGFSVPQTVCIIAGLCLVTCVGALLSRYFRKDVLAICTMAFVLGTMVSFKIFGHVEFGLIVHRLLPALRRGVVKPIMGRSDAARHTVRSYHLYGSCDWDSLWTALVESAETFRMNRIEFRIAMPSIGESFYAVWAMPNTLPDEETWNMSTPLFFDGRPVGNLTVTGGARQSVIHMFDTVTDFLEPIEDQIAHLVAESRDRVRQPKGTAAEKEPKQTMHMAADRIASNAPAPSFDARRRRSRRRKRVDLS
jgi:UDP-GlcNAc:undecaprenyl-phosphate GlcNAc-1-phosphate transferase